MTPGPDEHAPHTAVVLDPDDDLVPPPSLGTVLEQGRGSLPFALLHGEALVACAAWAMGQAGVTLIDAGTPWSSIVLAEEPVVLHDSLCPMTPPDFIAACVAQALAADAVVVGVRAVTDTLKEVHDGVVGGTLDRDALWSVVSPLVLPPSVVATTGDAGPEGLEPTLDLARLVVVLAGRHRVEHREAPASARRVSSTEDVALLAAVTGPHRAGA